MYPHSLLYAFLPCLLCEAPPVLPPVSCRARCCVPPVPACPAPPALGPRSLQCLLDCPADTCTASTAWKMGGMVFGAVALRGVTLAAAPSSQLPSRYPCSQEGRTVSRTCGGSGSLYLAAVGDNKSKEPARPRSGACAADEEADYVACRSKRSPAWGAEPAQSFEFLRNQIIYPQRCARTRAPGRLALWRTGRTLFAA